MAAHQGLGRSGAVPSCLLSRFPSFHPSYPSPGWVRAALHTGPPHTGPLPRSSSPSFPAASRGKR